MSKAEKCIEYMLAEKAKGIKYSMTYRLKDGYGDCSSKVFMGLIYAGSLKQNSFIGITDTLIEMGATGRVLMPIEGKDVKRGDIFVMGRRGASAGAAGHTGFFYGNGKIIHCNYRNNGITIDKIYFPMSTSADRHFYRIVESAPAMTTQEALRPLAINKNISTKAIKLKDEVATATCTVDYINIRSAPSTAAKIVDKLYDGMSIRYRAVYKADGHRWLEFKTTDGDLRYLPYRREDNIKDQWVKFS